MCSTTKIAPARVSPKFLEPYQRITSTGAFIPEVDGLRFLAILSVFIFHLAGDVLRHSPGAPQPAGWIFATTQVLSFGVPLFFAISGFILGTPFAAAHLQQRRPVSLKKYFLRRLTRLEPPYILSLLLFFVLKIAAGKGSISGLLPNLVASLFYAHNAVFGMPSAINFVAWSLEVEVQFYIVAPVLGMVFAIRPASLRRVVLVALILVSTGISILVSPHPALVLSLLGNAQYFLAGFALAEFFLSGGDRRQRNWLWDVVSALGWPLLLALLVGGASLSLWVFPWLILVLYIASFHGVVMNRFITKPWITTIGGMCYSIYLLHNYIIATLGMLTERFFVRSSFNERLVVQFLLMTPFVLVICGLYFRLIERPCMRSNWPQELKASIRLRTRAWTAS
jgi:peptidoglycan/LPS O-acetylase OafA/YrhL